MKVFTQMIPPTCRCKVWQSTLYLYGMPTLLLCWVMLSTNLLFAQGDCRLDVECLLEHQYITCIDEVPEPDTTLIIINESCGEATIHVEDEILEGRGCTYDQLTVWRMYTVTDENNNEFTCMVDYFVRDSIPPVWDHAPGELDQMVSCASELTPIVPPTATDCSEVLIKEVSNSTNRDVECSDNYVQHIVYEALDDCKNKATYEITITVDVGDNCPCDDDCPLTDNVYDATTCTCTFEPNITCNDDKDCTIDQLDLENCECRFINNPDLVDSCDDGKACTIDTYNYETCSCEFTNNPDLVDSCDDDKDCTVDTYNYETCSCEFVNNPDLTDSCDDGKDCTVDTYNYETCDCDFTNNPDLADTCDDNKECTIDTYNYETCDCEFTNNPDLADSCDDGKDCTVDTYNYETCQCEFVDDPDLVVCNDDKDCTIDSYNYETCQCEFVNNPDLPATCNDDKDCTIDQYDYENCECRFINNPDLSDTCDDGKDCTMDTYNYETCDCEFTNNPDLADSCDDGKDCTVDTYNYETCQCEFVDDPGLVVCDDGKTCTIDSYNYEACQCEFVNNPDLPATCNDDKDCTIDQYDYDNCECRFINNPDFADDCDDGKECTIDSYNYETCSCENENDPDLSNTCDDGKDCTMDSYNYETCDCEFTNNPDIIVDCYDGKDCTLDNYNYETCTCEFPNDPDLADSCDDGKTCTIDQYDYENCECQFIPNPELEDHCNDGKDCTIDTYNYDICQCEFTNNPDIDPTCDDGKDCTTDTYNYETCTCEFTNNPDLPATCDDGKDCTLDTYNYETCQCENENDPDLMGDCNDDKDCTIDQYDYENCECRFINNPDLVDSCDDGKDCTIDTYNYDTCECEHQNDPDAETTCSDGKECTTDSYNYETCSCVFIGIPAFADSCDDGRDCTIDSYDYVTCECVSEHDLNLNQTCDDGKDCTIDQYDYDNCECRFINNPALANSCDDGVDCTIDTYNYETCACEHEPVGTGVGGTFQVTACAGDAIHLNDIVNAPADAIWEDDNGDTIPDPTAVMVQTHNCDGQSFTFEGFFTLTDEDGCPVHHAELVTVTVYPQINVATTISEGGCMVSLTTNCEDYTIAWEDDLGNNGDGLIYTAAQGTEGTVTWTVTNPNVPEDLSCYSESTSSEFDCCADGIIIVDAFGYACSGDFIHLDSIVGFEDKNVSWTDGQGNPIADPTNVFVETTNCDGEIIGFSGTATETNNDGCTTTYQIGLGLTVYPAIETTITVKNDGCMLTLNTNCTNFLVLWEDDLGNSGKGLTYEADDNTSGTVIWMVTNPTIPTQIAEHLSCAKVEVSEDFNCCNGFTLAVDAIGFACSGESINLNEIVGQTDDTPIEWTLNGETVEDPTDVTLMTQNCAGQVYGFAGELTQTNEHGCESTTIYGLGITIYPTLEGNLSISNDGCTVTLNNADHCADDIKWMDTFGNEGTGTTYNADAGTIGTVTFTLVNTNITTNLTCDTLSITQDFDCCAEDMIPIDKELFGCSGESINLNEVVNLTGIETAIWLDENDEPIADPTNVFLQNEACEPLTMHFSTSLTTDGDDCSTTYVVGVAVTIYPAIEGNLTLSNNGCTVTATTDCDYTVNWEDDLGNSGMGMTYEAEEGTSGTLTFTITNENEPADLATACKSLTLTQAFNCCANGTIAVDAFAQLCSGDTLNLVDVVGIDGAENATWFHGAMEVDDPMEVILTNENCETLHTGFNTTFTVTNNDDCTTTYIVGIGVEVYPQITTTVSYSTDSCTVMLSQDCPQFTAKWDDYNEQGIGFSYTTPIEEGWVGFTITNPNAPDHLSCHNLIMAIDFICQSQNCDKTLAVDAFAQICSGDTLNLVELVGIDGIEAATWLHGGMEIADPTEVILTNEDCDVLNTGLTTTFDVVDADGCTTTYIVAVGVEVYPQITTTVDFSNEECKVTISQDCPQFTATWGDGTSEGDGFMYTSPISGIWIHFEVTNPDAPEHLDCHSKMFVYDFVCRDTGGCPAIAIARATPAVICSGETSQLSVGVADDDGGLVEWYDQNDEKVTNPGEIMLTNEDCSPKVVSFYAVYTPQNPDCPADTSRFVNITVYPAITAMIASADTCQVTLAAVCDGYAVTWTDNMGNTGNGLTYTAAAGTSGDVTFTVTNEAAQELGLTCATARVTTGFSCPNTTEICPTTADFEATASATTVCDGETIQLQTVLANGAMGTVVWTHNGTVIDDPSQVSLSLADACQKEAKTFIATFIPDNTACPHISKEVEISIYPNIQVEIDPVSACIIKVQRLCPAYIINWEDNLGNSGFGDRYIAEAGTNGIVTFTIVNPQTPNNLDCYSEQISANFNCPAETPCPTFVDGDFVSQEICSGDTISLPTDIIADEDGGNLTWYDEGEKSIDPADLEDIVLMAEGCGQRITSFRVVYNPDTPGCPTITAIYQFIIYPSIQAEIIKDVTNCTISLNPLCEDYVIIWEDGVGNTGTTTDYVVPMGTTGWVKFDVVNPETPEHLPCHKKRLVADLYCPGDEDCPNFRPIVTVVPEICSGESIDLPTDINELIENPDGGTLTWRDADGNMIPLADTQDIVLTNTSCEYELVYFTATYEPTTPNCDPVTLTQPIIVYPMLRVDGAVFDNCFVELAPFCANYTATWADDLGNTGTGFNYQAQAGTSGTVTFTILNPLNLANNDTNHTDSTDGLSCLSETLRLPFNCAANCQAEAGTISVPNPYLCLGLVSQATITTTNQFPLTNEYGYFVVDDAGSIVLDISPSNIVNYGLLSSGTYCIYGISYDPNDPADLTAGTLVALLAGGGCFDITDCLTVTVVSEPVANITSSPTCNDDGTFSVGITVTGGTGTAILQGLPNEPTVVVNEESIFDLPADGETSYAILAVDAVAGCSTDFLQTVGPVDCEEECLADGGNISVPNHTLCLGLLSQVTVTVATNAPDNYEYGFCVVDINGTIVLEVANSNVIDYSDLAPGAYCIFGLSYDPARPFDFDATTIDELNAGGGCFDMTPCLPIVIVTEPVAHISSAPSCNDDGTFDIGITVTGGTGTAILQGLPNNPVVVIDEENIFTFDGDGETIYTVLAVDAVAGCSTDFIQTFGPIFCPLPGSVSIGDFVFADVNSSGFPDEGEEGIAGVTVYLMNENGDTIVTQQTGVDGSYLFDNLPAGTYTVSVAVLTAPGALTSDESYTVTLNAGESFLDADFGFFSAPAACIEAINDAVTIIENTGTSINVRLNDIAPEGCTAEELQVVSVSQITPGATVTIFDNAIISYQPPADFAGVDSFQYTITCPRNPAGCVPTATAWVMVTVLPDNGEDCLPRVDTQYICTNPVIPITVCLPEPNCNNVEITNLHSVFNCQAVLLNDTCFRYLPIPGFLGTDTLKVTVCNEENPTLCSTSIVIMDVPCYASPIAVEDLDTTQMNTSIFINTLDNDSFVGEVTVNIIDQPDNGTAVVTDNGVVYIPNMNFVGTDTLTYQITDVRGNTATAFVLITVEGEPEVCMVESHTCAKPSQRIMVCPAFCNENQYDYRVTQVSINQGGTYIELTNGCYWYTPADDFTGLEVVSITACTNSGVCSTNEIFVNVTENCQIVANDDAFTTTVNQSIAVDLLANDFDPEGDNFQVTEIMQPANGFVNLVDGVLTYIPNDGFTGLDEFNYIICDDNGDCDQATVTITVLPEEDCQPIMEELCALPVVPLDICVEFCQVPDAMMTHLETTFNCSTTDLGNNCFRYIAVPGYEGLDSVIVTGCNANDVCEDITVRVQVGCPAPMAMNDVLDATIFTTTNANVLLNDTQDCAYELTATLIDQPQYGTASLLPSGQLVYMPNDNAGSQTEILSYIACNNCDPSKCDTAQIIIHINGGTPPVNEAPIAMDESIVTPENVATSINVLFNDSDPNPQDVLTATLIDLPVNGTVEFDGTTGIAIYTPNAGFTGTDRFTYEVCDNGNPVLCDVATTFIEVIPVAGNQPPIANNDEASVINTNDASVLVNVLANDFDSDGDNLSITVIGQAANGTATLAADGSGIIYTPNPEFVGTDMFTYTVCDDGDPQLCDQAIVTITVTAESTENNAPIATNDTETTDENTNLTIDVLANDSDPDGDNIHIDSFDQPNNGTVTLSDDGLSLVYTPHVDFTGVDVFLYVICDDGNPSLCDQAIVTINVQPIIGNRPPIAVDDEATVAINGTVNIDALANDSDPDGDEMSIGSVGAAANGTVVVENGLFVYTPNAGFAGIDTFTYMVCDHGIPVLCDHALVTITIISTSGENEPPVAQDDFASVQGGEMVSIDVLDNDSDPDGDSIVLTAVGDAMNGTVAIVDGEIVYTPNAGFVGIDSFTYTVCDDSIPPACDQATVTITVTEPPVDTNRPPVAVDDAANGTVNTPLPIDVLANDSDPNNDPLTLSVVDAPTNGTVFVSDDGTEVIYTPNADFVGVDSFVYLICDDAAEPLCDEATVVVTIYPEGATPIDAEPDMAFTRANTMVVIPVLDNDSGAGISLNQIVQLPQNGTVVANLDGTITYTPNPDFVGTDFFIYEICDTLGNCDQAIVGVTVVPEEQNQAPIANDDMEATEADTPVTINVLANDSDPDGDDLTVGTPSDPANGSVMVNENGTITYTPDAGFTGVDQFTYVVCDPEAACDTATVIVTVNMGMIDNRPPVAIDDMVFTPLNEAVTINALMNDSDPDGDNIDSVRIGVPPMDGMAMVNEDGTITYTPNTDYEGVDEILYIICDDAVPVLCDTARITITITNDIPVEVFEIFETTLENTPVTICVEDHLALPFAVDSIAIFTNPNNGSVALADRDSCLVYTPDSAFVGMDTLKIGICNEGLDRCDTVYAHITVEPDAINQAPIAVNDTTTTGVNEAIMIPVLLNDTDPDGDLISVIAIETDPQNGETMISQTGQMVTYTPDSSFVGIDSFQYIIADPDMEMDTAWVFINITEEIDTMPNMPHIVAVDDQDTTVANTDVDVMILLNDTIINPDNEAVIVTELTMPMNGSVLINSNGTTDALFTYRPNFNFEGVDTFRYSVCIADTICDTALVTIVVLPDPDEEEDLCEPDVPSGFSPNGDGINDHWTLGNIGACSTVKISIFNRWGDVVYKTANYDNDEAWDGTWQSNGEALPDGTYFYIATVTSDGGRTQENQTGFIELHR